MNSESVPRSQFNINVTPFVGDLCHNRHHKSAEIRPSTTSQRSSGWEGRGDNSCWLGDNKLKVYLENNNQVR
jgi:hypothetical protein